jgi:hypothetical protein
MPNKLMLAFLGFDFLFAGCGGLLLGFSLMSEAAMQEAPTVANVTQNLLLGQCPLTGMTTLGGVGMVVRRLCVMPQCGIGISYVDLVVSHIKKRD